MSRWISAMPAIGEVGDRPEAGGRDRWRAGTEADVEQLERPGVHDDGQVPVGRPCPCWRPGAASAVNCSLYRHRGNRDAAGVRDEIAGCRRVCPPSLDMPGRPRPYRPAAGMVLLFDQPHSVTARRLRRRQRALTLREGMMGRWAPAGMSRGLSALVTLFPPGRCGYATPVIAPARGRSHLPCGAPSSILT
jgi:hypothetical protein